MRMIRANSLLSWTSLRESRKLAPDEYIEWNNMNANAKAATLIFVSHRWITPIHPDPDGNQLREVQTRLINLLDSDRLRNAVVFYDYSSMLQRPRTPEEDAQFQRDIASLESLIHSAHNTIILSEGYTDYRNRAWCFFEAMVSKRNVHLFQDQTSIKDDLSFLDWLFDEDFPQITSYDFSYKTNANEAEIIVAIFQHLKACRLTHADDFPRIKEQMVAHLNRRRLTSFGRLIVALNKYFDVSFAIFLPRERRDILCKPYFEVPDWRQLPKLPGDSFLGDAGKPASVFALPHDQLLELQDHPGQAIMPALRVSLAGVDDHMQFLQTFQNDADWQRYVVSPMMLGERGDCFPSIDHVIHTILERPPGFFASEDRSYLYFFLARGT